jgi:hypothetical protein
MIGKAWTDQSCGGWKYGIHSLKIISQYVTQASYDNSE